MIVSLILFLFLSAGHVCGNRFSTTEGIIISGGSGNLASVEVFDPSSGLSCSLPALPNDRWGHTMNSLLICGGGGTNCLSFTSGQWITSHNLLGKRYGHTSWQTEQGLVLMGGGINSDTSEIVPTDGGQGGPSFAMQYSTGYACSMQDLTSDSLIITGGYITLSRVSRYGTLGWVEDLPPLVVGRQSHGCGSFFRGDGTQVFLVAGGNDDNYIPFSSTEMLTMDSPGWTLTTPLPRAVRGVIGVTMGGTLYMTGGIGHSAGDGNSRDDILVWLDDEQEWQEIGKMKMGRNGHAVSIIQMDDQAMEHCG